MNPKHPPRISQMTGRTGQPVANQFIIETAQGVYFQSYDSIIAFRPDDIARPWQLDRRYWDYSRTTARYRNQFLGLSTKETEKRIADGRIELTDLN